MRVLCCVFFFFKQKTAYEMRISDWSSDVCSSDLHDGAEQAVVAQAVEADAGEELEGQAIGPELGHARPLHGADQDQLAGAGLPQRANRPLALAHADPQVLAAGRSEEHTSELQSLMRISYAVFCLKKKKTIIQNITIDRTPENKHTNNTTNTRMN